MRIVIFTVDHIYSNRVIKSLIDEFGKDIILVVESGVLLHNKSLITSLKNYLQISGPYYVYIQMIKLMIYKISSKIYSHIFSNYTSGKFYSYKIMASKFGINRQKVVNVNDEIFRTVLKKNKPDLFISVFFNQLIKPETIKISKNGAINIHPAYLPDYKGVSPVFWALANGEESSGVSIHYINEGIDTGRIIKKEKVRIDKNDTEDSLYWKSVMVGVPLLISTIQNLKEGKVKSSSYWGGRYFSLPTKEAIKRFKVRKRRFFRLVEYLFQN